MVRVKNDKKVIVRGSKKRLVDLLTKRELDVLKLIAQGDTTKIMAGKLGISEKTADTHRSNINSKMMGLTGHTFPTELLTQMAIKSRIVPLQEFPFLIIDPPPQ